MIRWLVLVAVMAIVTVSVSVGGVQAQDETVDLLDGLISWWQMEEASGVRYDSHGFSHLTDVNTVGISLGIVGNAAYAQAASSEYLSSASSALSTRGEDFTIAGYWSVSSSSLTYLMRRRTGSYSEYDVYMSGGSLYLRATSTVPAYYQRSTACNVPGYPAAIFGVLIIENDELRVFCNGAISVPTAVPDRYFDNTLTVQFGTGTPSDIIMDEIAMWSRALNSAEIEHLYNAGLWRSYGDIAASAVTTYKTSLPSGGSGVVEMSATAGEIGVIGLMMVIVVLLIFVVLRDMAKRMRPAAK